MAREMLRELAPLLRSDSAEIKTALSRQGRYTDVAENMRVKEVRVSTPSGS